MSKAFTLVREQALTETDGIVRLYRHNETGAQLLSVVNKDENKVFGVTFRTPSKNATGVAHIMEHSTLCGSDKYPVKEPFLVLMQGSLQSFLNAFTYPDKTCYPVASANLQDFYNLVDVYIDAVFHPLITKNIFRQEGWHIECDEPNGPWQYKGVVFNEMKGVYSSPESVLSEECQHAIFPDNVYRKDSGGDPTFIPSLTYEQFRAFHDKFYHPSNARFYFWGDDPEEERLNIVDRAVAGMGVCQCGSEVAMQQPFAAPIRVTRAYAAEEGSKCLFAVNWLTGVRGDLERTMMLEMLQHILEGMPGSPLRRALISSGLGESMAGVGLETSLIQTFYSTGLKGIAEEDIAKAEDLIFSTLRDLADKGIDPSLVEAAVNSVEFTYREYNFGFFPQGLVAMIQALSTWLYDADPLESLAWEKPLADIKVRLAAGEKVFEKAIQELLLDNPTRASVILTPDTGLSDRIEQDEKARLEALREAASPEERQKIYDDCQELQRLQAKPDSPEALATIPNLKVTDMPLKNRTTPITVQEDKLLSFASSEQPTRGIAYVNALIPMPLLPARLIPCLSVLTSSFTSFGTARRDYTGLGALISAKTGGLRAVPSLRTDRNGDLRCYLSLSGKAVSGHIPDLFAIMEEILLEPQPDKDVKLRRLKELLLQEKADLETDLVQTGNMTARGRLLSRFTKAGRMLEMTCGVDYLATVCGWLDQWEERKEHILEDMDELRRLLVASRPSILSCVGSDADISTVYSLGSALLGRLPSGTKASGAQIVNAAPACRAEVLTAPSQVNYVAKGCDLSKLGCRYNGHIQVILRHVSRSYLWETVRVLGGAYGAGCSMDRFTGVFSCTSFRDPNIEETIKAYDGIAGHLESKTISAADLERAIVGAIGVMDSYMLPSARGGAAISSWLAGDSEEDRQQLRDETLSTTPQDFKDFAAVLREAARQGDVCVVGGAAAGRLGEEKGWRVQSLS